LGAESDIMVVGEAGDGEEALARARVLHPDVVLMDVRMPTLNGIEATRRLTVTGLPHHHDVRLGPQHSCEPRSEHGLIVDDEDFDGHAVSPSSAVNAAGMRAKTR
jgi:hypothetical protein